MSKHPSSGRKPTSVFVNEDSPHMMRHKELTPRTNTFLVERKDDQSPSGGLVSKTNIIGDSLLVQDKSRSVVLTTAGKKLSSSQDIEMDKFQVCDNISQDKAQGDGVHHKNVEKGAKFPKKFNISSAAHEITKNHKLKKRSKVSLRHANQKPHITFTPRHVDSSLAYVDHLKSTSTTSNTNAETQTNHQVELYAPLHFTSGNANSLPLNIPTPSLTRDIPNGQEYNRYSKSVPQNQHLVHPLDYLKMPMSTNLCTKSQAETENYTDLRRIISFLTLITVLSWFISIYFEFEILTNVFDYALQTIRTWYLGKRKPKTKLELFIEFVADLFA